MTGSDVDKVCGVLEIGAEEEGGFRTHIVAGGGCITDGDGIGLSSSGECGG